MSNRHFVYFSLFFVGFYLPLRFPSSSESIIRKKGLKPTSMLREPEILDKGANVANAIGPSLCIWIKFGQYANPEWQLTDGNKN